MHRRADLLPLYWQIEPKNRAILLGIPRSVGLEEIAEAGVAGHGADLAGGSQTDTQHSGLVRGHVRSGVSGWGAPAEWCIKASTCRGSWPRNNSARRGAVSYLRNTRTRPCSTRVSVFPLREPVNVPTEAP